MFAWLSKRVMSTWSRRTRWTPLLLSQRQFQRALAKERSRVDRSGSRFGFLILRLANPSAARSQTVKLAKLLHRRLRDTDEKGHLGPGRLGVMLPDTGAEESELVYHDILKLAGRHNLRIDGEVLGYPDHEVGLHKPGAASPAGEGVQVGAPSLLAVMLPDYPLWKRSLDLLGASLGLVFGAPLLALLAVLVKATSRGPVLFCQRRTGYLGRPFTIYKLRTMVVNAEELKGQLAEDNERDGPAFKMRKDPRITPMGRFLRASGLDELPQLVNVLRGDMSLVGPRPLPVDEAQQCQTWQKRRQDVKPGLTCFWQLTKNRNISFADWMRLDLKYSQRISFLLDVRLILRTFSSVLFGRVGH